MLATVAGDLARDASGMANQNAKPKVYELAALLVNMRKAIAADNWADAATQWATFNELQKKYDEDMY
jgi:hypothetical protein